MVFTSISRYQNASEIFGAFFLQHNNNNNTAFIFSTCTTYLCKPRSTKGLEVDPGALDPTFPSSLRVHPLVVAIVPCSCRGTDGHTRFVARGNHGGMGGPSDTGGTMTTQQHTSLSSPSDGDGAPSAVHKRVTRSSAAAAAAATAAEVRPACGAWCLADLHKPHLPV